MTQLMSVLDVDMSCSPPGQAQLQPAGTASDHSSRAARDYCRGLMEMVHHGSFMRKPSRSMMRSTSEDFSHRLLVDGLGSGGDATGSPWDVEFHVEAHQQGVLRQQEEAPRRMREFGESPEALVLGGQEPSSRLCASSLNTQQQRLGWTGSPSSLSQREPPVPHSAADESHVEIIFVRDEAPYGELVPSNQHPVTSSHLLPRRGTPGSGSLDTFLGSFGSGIEEPCIIHCDQDPTPFRTPIRLPPELNTCPQNISGLPASGSLDQGILADCPEASLFTPATVPSSSVAPGAAVELGRERRRAPVLPPLRPPSRVPGALELPSPGALSPMSMGTSPDPSPQATEWSYTGPALARQASDMGAAQGARAARGGSRLATPKPLTPLVPLTPCKNIWAAQQQHRRITSIDSSLPGFPGFSVPSAPSSATPKPRPPRSPATPSKSPLPSPAEGKAPLPNGVLTSLNRAASMHRKGHSWSTAPAFDSSARVPGGSSNAELATTSQVAGSFGSALGVLTAHHQGAGEVSIPRGGGMSDLPLQKSASAGSTAGVASSSKQPQEDRARKTLGTGTPPLPIRRLPKAHSFSDAGGMDRAENQAPKSILVPNDGRLRRSQSLGLKVKFCRRVEVVYV